MRQEKTGSAERVNTLPAQFEAAQDLCTRASVKSYKMYDPAAAQAVIHVSDVRLQDGNLARVQHSFFIVKIEFSDSGHTVKNLPKRKAAGPPDRLLHMVEPDIYEEQRNSLPLTFGHIERIVHIRSLHIKNLI